MSRWRSLGFSLCALALPAQAAAFSDYEVFSLPPTDSGGGGGRFFTGSTSDGYTCAVCHRGAPPPTLQLSGLPERELVAGTTYDVEIVWTAPDQLHALNLEFVTPQGVAAGTIVLPDPATLLPADLCNPALQSPTEPPTEGPATHLIEESAPRQVLWMDDCGASRLRFRYTASGAAEVMFAAAVVRTDKSEKPEGDGVTELRRTLYLQGLAPAAESCSSTPGTDAPAGAALVLLGLALSLRARRRKHNR
jgi:MYXO-CTERM domain-containing protein